MNVTAQIIPFPVGHVLHKMDDDPPRSVVSRVECIRGTWGFFAPPPSNSDADTAALAMSAK